MSKRKSYPRNATLKIRDRERARRPEVRAKNRLAVRRYQRSAKGLAKAVAERLGKARRNRALTDSIKTIAKCSDCHQNYPPCVMDFDHVRGVKTRNIGTMVSQGFSLEALYAEIAKCEVVCSNCHRVRTSLRVGRKRPDLCNR